ncbi:hypothetical protein TcWFU_003316 [Taenia crassiceps]|uniref:Uncharacterized protein n=1 Tax=Taenia crassiceps TaxID=6207 RepID=A0ABR4Q4B9_9CEST
MKGRTKKQNGSKSLLLNILVTASQLPCANRPVAAVVRGPVFDFSVTVPFLQLRVELFFLEEDSLCFELRMPWRSGVIPELRHPSNCVTELTRLVLEGRQSVKIRSHIQRRWRFHSDELSLTTTRQSLDRTKRIDPRCGHDGTGLRIEGWAKAGVKGATTSLPIILAFGDISVHGYWQAKIKGVTRLDVGETRSSDTAPSRASKMETKGTVCALPRDAQCGKTTSKCDGLVDMHCNQPPQTGADKLIHRAAN